MKRLQRGIKNKDPNNKSLKLEFERCKKELEDWCRGLREDFSSNRSQSRSKERSTSPAGTYTKSRIFSPNSRSPGGKTPPKGKLNRSKDQNKKIPKSRSGLRSAAGTQHVAKTFANLIKNPSHEELDVSANHSREDIRQPNFDANDNINMFSPEERSRDEANINSRSQDLSRTTFGVKSPGPKGSGQGSVNISKDEYESLKVALVQMVEAKENELKMRLNTITDDLNAKTVALNNMRRSLVEKLKELDASLAETNREFQRS